MTCSWSSAGSWPQAQLSQESSCPPCCPVPGPHGAHGQDTGAAPAMGGGGKTKDPAPLARTPDQKIQVSRGFPFLNQLNPSTDTAWAGAQAGEGDPRPVTAPEDWHPPVPRPCAHTPFPTHLRPLPRRRESCLSLPRWNPNRIREKTRTK